MSTDLDRVRRIHKALVYYYRDVIMLSVSGMGRPAVLCENVPWGEISCQCSTEELVIIIKRLTLR